MTAEEQEVFFAGAAKHGNLAAAFWQVATDADATRGDHEDEAYVAQVFAAAIRAAVGEEREACAKIAESEHEEWHIGQPCLDAAKKIRARKSGGA